MVNVRLLLWKKNVTRFAFWTSVRAERAGGSGGVVVEVVVVTAMVVMVVLVVGLLLFTEGWR